MYCEPGDRLTLLYMIVRCTHPSLPLPPPPSPAQLVTRPSDEVDVRAGNTLLLTCVGLGESPAISWRRGDESAPALTNTSRVSIFEESYSEGELNFAQSVLELCSAEESDAGQYYCVVTSGATADSGNFTVNVITTPATVVIAPPLDSFVVDGNTLALTCVAYGYPLPQITWYQVEGAASELMNTTDNVIIYDELFTQGSETFVTSTLFLCSQSVGDSAMYRCGADNGIPGGDTPTSNFTVTVQGKCRRIY